MPAPNCEYGGHLVDCPRPTTFSAPDNRWLCRRHHLMAEAVRRDTEKASA